MIEFWLHEYEEILGEVFGDADDEEYGVGVPGPGQKDIMARNRLGQLMRGNAMGKETEQGEGEEYYEDEEEISDSESVVSVGQLGGAARLDEPGLIEESALSRHQRRQSGNENTWEVRGILERTWRDRSSEWGFASTCRQQHCPCFLAHLLNGVVLLRARAVRYDRLVLDTRMIRHSMRSLRWIYEDRCRSKGKLPTNGKGALERWTRWSMLMASEAQ